MALQIRWHPLAASDLEEIVNFIEKDSPQNAVMVADRLVLMAEDIQLFPRSGRVVPELERDDVRERIVFNYRVMYQLTSAAISIIAIFHGSRLFPRHIASRLR